MFRFIGIIRAEQKLEKCCFKKRDIENIIEMIGQSEKKAKKIRCGLITATWCIVLHKLGTFKRSTDLQKKYGDLILDFLTI